MEDKREVRDSNGTLLSEGDSISIIKDLKVKGSNSGLKRGTIIKNISINQYGDEEIECRGAHRGLMLKACYVKKV